MKKLLQFGVFLSGFLGAHLVFESITIQPWKYRVFEKSDQHQLKAFATGTDKETVAIVSNCILGHYDTRNDIQQKLKVINKVSGLFSEIANLVSLKNSLNYDFINFSRTHFSPRDLTPILFNILQNSSTQTVVFNLDYNSMHLKQSTDLASTLESVLTLRKISELYPDLKPDAEKILQYIISDPIFKTAVLVYGEQFHSFADAKYLTVPRYDTEGMNSYWLSQNFDNLSQIQSKIKLKALTDHFQLFDGLTTSLQYLIFSLSGHRKFELDRIDGEFKGEVAKMTLDIGHPLLDAPILNAINDESRKYLDSELYLIWLELFLKIAKKKNKEFVYFFTPSLDGDKAAGFELNQTYVKPVSDLVHSYHFRVLDLSTSHLLQAEDLITRNSLISYTIAVNSSAFYKLYRQPNLLGKVKLAESLVEFLNGKPLKNRLQTNVAMFSKTYLEPRFTDIHSVINSERQAIYSIWSQTVTSEYFPYFSENQITPQDYFNKDIFQAIKQTEISWLNGQGQLAFMCARVIGGCGPSHHLKSNVFQKIGEF